MEHGAAAQALKASDDGVSVFTELPKNRPTELPGPRPTLRVEQVRVPKWMPRALAWVWFTWQARKRIPRMDWDVCVLMTDPPLLPLLAARAKAAEGLRDYGTTGPRDATRRVAVWLMDLYPEALAASGRLGRNNPLYKWYFSKRQRALGASDLLLFLGETQKALVGKYEGEKVGRWEEQNETGDGGQQPGDRPSGSESLPSGLEALRARSGVGEGQVAVKTEKPNYRTTEPPRPPLTQRVRTVVVPPWDDRGNIALATEESLKNLALYAGNLGEAHCFEEILAAASYLPGDWTIRFAARGAKLSALRAKASQSGHGDLSHSRPEGDSARYSRGQINASQKKASHGLTRIEEDLFSGGDPAGKSLLPEGAAKSGATVHVSGYVSEEETPGLLASARVHLITMSPGWEGIVVPSKLYGCIRTGRPVLFIGPENADTAREIRAHDWGKVLPPGASGEEVAAAILELAAWPTRATESLNGAAEVGQLIQALATD